MMEKQKHDELAYAHEQARGCRIAADEQAEMSARRAYLAAAVLDNESPDLPLAAEIGRAILEHPNMGMRKEVSRAFSADSAAHMRTSYRATVLARHHEARAAGLEADM